VNDRFKEILIAAFELPVEERVQIATFIMGNVMDEVGRNFMNIGARLSDGSIDVCVVAAKGEPAQSLYDMADSAQTDEAISNTIPNKLNEGEGQ
jgi:hypothetical protein